MLIDTYYIIVWKVTHLLLNIHYLPSPVICTENIKINEVKNKNKKHFPQASFTVWRKTSKQLQSCEQSADSWVDEELDPAPESAGLEVNSVLRTSFRKRRCSSHPRWALSSFLRTETQNINRRTTGERRLGPAQQRDHIYFSFSKSGDLLD